MTPGRAAFVSLVVLFASGCTHTGRPDVGAPEIGTARYGLSADQAAPSAGTRAVDLPTTAAAAARSQRLLRLNGVPLDEAVRKVVTTVLGGAVLIQPATYRSVDLEIAGQMNDGDVVHLLSRVAAAHGASFSVADGVFQLSDGGGADGSGGASVAGVASGTPAPSPAAGGSYRHTLWLSNRKPSDLVDLANATGSVKAVADDATRAMVVTGPLAAVLQVAAAVSELDRPRHDGVRVLWRPSTDAAGTFQALQPYLPAGVTARALRGGLLLSGSALDVEQVERLLPVVAASEPVTYVYRPRGLRVEDCGRIVQGLYGGGASLSTSSKSDFPGGAVGDTTTTGGLGASVVGGGALSGSGKGADTGMSSSPSLAPAAAPTTGFSFGLPDAGLAVVGVDGRCVLRGVPHYVAEAARLLSEVDRRRPTVVVDAVLFEASYGSSEALGVRVIVEKSGLILKAGEGGDPLSSIGSAVSAVGVGLGGVKAVIDAVKEVGEVKLLSAPQVWADLGEHARIIVGDRVPTVGRLTTSAVTGTVSGIEYQDVGIILDIEPVEAADGRIRLLLSQESSDATRTTTSGIDSPTIQRRAVRTTITAGDGQTLLIGGLLRRSSERSRQGLPWVEDVPLLGDLLTRASDKASTRELVLLVTPRIVDDGGVAERARRAVERIALLGGGK